MPSFWYTLGWKSYVSYNEMCVCVCVCVCVCAHVGTLLLSSSSSSPSSQWYLPDQGDIIQIIIIIFQYQRDRCLFYVHAHGAGGFWNAALRRQSLWIIWFRRQIVGILAILARSLRGQRQVFYIRSLIPTTPRERVALVEASQFFHDDGTGIWKITGKCYALITVRSKDKNHWIVNNKVMVTWDEWWYK